MSIASDSDSVFSGQDPYINNRMYDGISSEADSRSYCDKNPNKVPFVVRVDPAKNRRVKVHYYETVLGCNRYIKNAVTGLIHPPYRTGTAHEDHFFSIMLSTGEAGETPPCLFYDSPEQYERHFYTTLPEQVKTLWHERYRELLYSQDSSAVEESGPIVVK